MNIGNKNIIKNNYRIQAYDSIICGYFCTGFIDFMLKGKSLLDYTNLFSPNDYEKNDKIIVKYFQYLKRCGYFCIRSIDFMLKGKSLLDYTNLFSPNDYEKNDKIILKYFQYLKR